MSDAGIELPVDTDAYNSVGGYVFGELGRLPKRGDSIVANNPFVLMLRDFGTQAQKDRYLWPMLAGDEFWCQLFSEPGAGSDLAGIRTTAIRDGDEWVVNGQKVWTSGARDADYGMLIARTDWDQPKHRGITFFWFPMRQPGVEVRPLRQVTGDSRFNEVFITDARVPETNRLGNLNDGWRVLQTALFYERVAMGGSMIGGGGGALPTRNARTPTSHSPPGPCWT